MKNLQMADHMARCKRDPRWTCIYKYSYFSVSLNTIRVRDIPGPLRFFEVFEILRRRKRNPDWPQSRGCWYSFQSLDQLVCIQLEPVLKPVMLRSLLEWVCFAFNWNLLNEVSGVIDLWLRQESVKRIMEVYIQNEHP